MKQELYEDQHTPWKPFRHVIDDQVCYHDADHRMEMLWHYGNIDEFILDVLKGIRDDNTGV